ncbi:hypothetical protein A5741_15660 [Mycolicibacterium conceptionense]|nr:hypothetical protein A5639_10885 [Mycolicibacterium conceptionense]OMB87798.1 hypothetical protein A5741_15660 [Mycolicibacterium conceptionense]
MGKRRELAMAGLVGAVASGMAVAAMSTPAPAHAWCVGISGINIGGGCSSTLGNFALGLGPNAVAVSSGFVTGAIAFGDAFASSAGILTAAWAGGTGSEAYTDGLVSWAVAQGTNPSAVAGRQNGDFANFAFNFGNALEPWLAGENEELGTSNVESSFGSFNLAANLGGNANSVEGTTKDMRVWAGGLEDNQSFGAAALNLLGNRNDVQAFGSGVAAIAVGNLFSFPNGSDSVVKVGDFLEGIPGGRLALAFNVQPPFITEPCNTGQCGNVVTVNNGYLSVAGAVGLVNRIVQQIGPGIRINTPINPAPPIPDEPDATETSIAAKSTPQLAPRKSISERVKAAVNRNLVRTSRNTGPEAKAVEAGSSALKATPKSGKSRISDAKNKSKAAGKPSRESSGNAKASAGGSDAD